MIRPRTLMAAAAAATLIFAAAGPVAAQKGPQPLTLGSVVTGQASSDSPAVFTFTAREAGMLTVVVRDKGDTDLILTVADALGQPLPDGRADQDLGGDTGAEQIVATLRSPGDYQVRVETYGGSGLFDIAASWLAFPSVAVAPDPDGMPTSGAALTPGTPINDSIDPSSGDMWDWFVVTADSDSVITVVTSAAEGDLALDSFAADDFTTPLSHSDQDMQGTAGNESVTVQARAGQKYYFKVSPVFGQEKIAYQIRVGIM